MSINSAMLAGVSGLVANSSALAAISDNIANVNTVAYKRNQVNFANVVTSQAVTGKYSAGGVQGITRQFVSQQGLVQSAGSATDLAIAGDGFFIVTDKGAGVTAQDARKFTRAGSFSVDSDGFLKNDAGLYLQGWPADASGTVNPNPSDLSQLQSINVRNLGAAVTSTSSSQVTANLNQALTPSAGAATYNTGAASMANFADGVAGGTQPDFSIPVNVIDSVGGSHKLIMSFLKDDTTANQWHAEIYASPKTDVSVAGPAGQIKAGDILFNQDGTIDLANSTLFGAAGSPTEIALDASGGANPKWDDGLGIAAQTISFDLANLTQYASPSTIKTVSSDGASVGNVIGVEVDENGFVSALFDNSQVRRIAQIGLATFPNPDGLKTVSGNAYRASVASGEFAIKQPGVGGAGQISPSSLEASTVDLSAEFTSLITTQRAYSASSKIITTADQMLEELLNIKR
jgi:flagellar hook protein FlgE